MKKWLIAIGLLVILLVTAAMAEARWCRRGPLRRVASATVRFFANRRPVRRVVSAPFRWVVNRRRAVRGYNEYSDYYCNDYEQPQTVYVIYMQYPQVEEVEIADPAEPVYYDTYYEPVSEQACWLP